MLFWPCKNYRPIMSKSKQRLMLMCYFHEVIEKPPPVACGRQWKHNNDDTVTLFSVNRAFYFLFYYFFFFTVAVNEPISQFSFCQEHTWITNLVTRQSWVSLNTDPVTENRSKWKTWHKVIQTWSCKNWMFPSCSKREISSNKLPIYFSTNSCREFCLFTFNGTVLLNNKSIQGIK